MSLSCPRRSRKAHRVCRANLNPPAYVTDPATGKVTHKFNSRRDAVFPVHTDMNLWYALARFAPRMKCSC